MASYEFITIWRIEENDSYTIARYDWLVNTTKTWMNILTPIAKPLFEWNHKVVMIWGAESLAKRLNTKVSEE